MKLMKSLGFAVAAVQMAFISTSVMAAVEPVQEKVEREVVIKAPVDKVWAVVTDFGAIDKWHPSVTKTAVETKADEDGKELPHRTLTLKDGGTLVHKESKKNDNIKKYEYKIVEGMHVKGYRAIFRVKPGANENESKVMYKARFFADKDGVKEVETFYDAGLPGLKAYIEAQ